MSTAIPRPSSINYTSDIEGILEKIRINSVLLSNVHKKRYLELNQSLKYYKIPIIVIVVLVVSSPSPKFTYLNFILPSWTVYLVLLVGQFVRLSCISE